MSKIQEIPAKASIARNEAKLRDFIAFNDTAYYIDKDVPREVAELLMKQQAEIARLNDELTCGSEAFHSVKADASRFALHCTTLRDEIEYLEEALGESLSDEDAAMVKQIADEAEAYLATPTETEKAAS